MLQELVPIFESALYERHTKPEQHGMNRENLERYVGERIAHGCASRNELSQSTHRHQQTRSEPEQPRAHEHEGRNERKREMSSRAAPERTGERDEGRTR